ncbi:MULTISPECIES: alpha/beta hydrolase [Saccharibacillus]|uniref:alpha/beta hydrolase n=1 Tax=Saccharibacillus TaxID=456492 RepID=UPI00123AA857|nr:alpha/beta hydrolase [Saccharibacillus sp. WB 17]MWJ30142.1 alpha/beta fold hydrolase [Saccharibacillus sp. WB 17]
MAAAQSENGNGAAETGKIKKKRKPLRIIRNVLGIFAGIIVLFFAIVFVTDKVAGSMEEARIEPYGQFVEVDGKRMNVRIDGDGAETIVLLPGYGTAAPGLDFEPLIRELEAKDYRIVTVEPFGYGLSDGTDKERTTDNIVGEVHEAVQQLGLTRYVLMGHSIAGLYGLEYANRYPDEVIAFAGIDTSVPSQGGMDTELPIGTFKFLRQSGLMRMLTKISGDPYAALDYDESTKEQMRMITNRKGNNKTMLNEMSHISSNFNQAKEAGATFPADLPLLLFIKKDDVEVTNWTGLHEEQVAHSAHGKLIPMEGDHYLHHTLSQEIATDFDAFMDGLGKKN